SEHSRRGLISVHVVESARANRIFVPLGGRLPLHATASGIAFLAFARPDVRAAALAGSLETYTPHTIADPASLASHVEDARRRGPPPARSRQPRPAAPAPPPPPAGARWPPSRPPPAPAGRAAARRAHERSRWQRPRARRALSRPPPTGARCSTLTLGQP